MKILHTADWHLGKRLDRYTRIEEQIEVLDEICQIADDQAVDIVIVAGDLFDTFNPPVEAVQLLYSTLKRLSKNGLRPIIAIAGNHDSPDRIDAPDILARECGIIFIGYPNAIITPFEIPSLFKITKSDKSFLEIKLSHCEYPIRVLVMPYANELRIKEYLGAEKEDKLNELLAQQWQKLADEYCDDQGVNILTTHLYMLKKGGEVLAEPDGEKPLKVGNAEVIYTDTIPKEIQYTALGHLHNFQQLNGDSAPVVYSSSPLSYSFSEAGQVKKVVIIEAFPATPVIVNKIDLKKGKPLIRKRFEDIDFCVKWLTENPYAWIELTIESDTFLTASDLKRIQSAHQGIVYIIPIVKNKIVLQNEEHVVNLDQNINGLFIDYFKSRHHQEPNKNILALFNEVLGNDTTN